MPTKTFNNLIASTKWDGSNKTHDGYKTLMNEISLRANNHDMAGITKIFKRLQEAPSFRRPVSRALPLGEKCFDEAHATESQRAPRRDSPCVLFCFIKLILGNHYVWSQGFIVSEPRETHPRSEIADVPTSPCPPLDNLGCQDPHPSP